ncbi:MAG: MFS transporter [Anaerovoracaceae bacterium]
MFKINQLQINKSTNWQQNIGFFIGGQFLSLFGSMLVQYAITWQITLQTQSGLIMSLFSCAILLPMVIISPFAGVWADRYNRKYLINISDGIIALVTAILAILMFLGYENIWLMLSIVAVRSFGQGVQQPAVNALIPQIVPAEHLIRINGIQGTVQAFTTFASPMLAGVLLSFFPIQYILLIDVITALIGISVVFFFVYVKHSKPESTQNPSYFGELKEGVHYIMKTPWLKVLMVVSALFGLLSAPACLLTPLQVTRSFGDDVWRLSAVEILFSVGMIAGGIGISAWGGFKNKVHTIMLSCIILGVTTILLGLVPSFFAYLLVIIICGASIPISNTPIMTILQTNIEPQVMGRVFSFASIIGGLAMPISMIFFGPLADKVSIELLLVITGILITVGGASLRFSKSLFLVGKEKN